MRVAISGIGAITAIGCGLSEFAKNIVDGVCGIEDATLPDGSVVEAALARGFDPRSLPGSRKLYLDRNSALAIGAAAEAIGENARPGAAIPAARFGLASATTLGNIATAAAFWGKVLEKGPRLAPPLLFPHAYANATNSLLSIEFGLRGPNCNFDSGFTAGAEAIAWAAGCIARGRADAVLAGGVEALCDAALLGGISDGMFSPDGFPPGEAAVMLLLESEASSDRRRAAPLAFIKGIGFACAPPAHLAAAVESAARRALEKSGLEAGRASVAVAGIRAAGKIDVEPALALSSLLGGDCAIIAPQVFTGAVFAASAPLAVAVAALGLQKGTFPPPMEIRGDSLSATESPAPINADDVIVISWDDCGDAVALLVGK